MSLLFRNRCAIAVTIVGCLLFAVRLPNKTLAQSIDAEQPPAAAPKYNLLPPRGIEIDSPSRQALQKRLDELSATLDEAANRSVDAATWRPHVAVLLRAVRLAITQDLFYKTSQVDDANKLLDEANRRIAAATDGKRGLELLGFDPDNDSLAQPLVGGFVSRIDDSFQPFGVVVPAGYNSKPASTPYRLDVWLHGRGDKTTEIPFLSERMTKVGQYAPEDTFVLHPFGRHCNAFKFAGETDVYESIDAMKDLVPVDSQRVSIRGFSMGGAGCWHLAVHDPTHWMAANPGAGFVDTIVYQGWTKATPFEVTPTMQKLFRWYDVLPWVENLNDTRVVAYSGEVDKQKRAADRVVEQAENLGFKFPYVIGAGMGHKIDKDSAAAIDTQLATWAKKVTTLPEPKLQFTTYTLRYNTAGWVRVTGMQEHWTAATVEASIEANEGRIELNTTGVTHLELDFSRSGWAGPLTGIDLSIDGEKLDVVDSGNQPGFQCRLAKLSSGDWVVEHFRTKELRKRPGLQGPIDDAFCDRFVIVLPSRPARHGRVQRWIDRETEYLQQRWQRLMRGDVQVVTDRELTDDQIATSHLICFGDFSSNRYLFNVADSLPIRWTRNELVVADETFDPANHAPVFCYPNPLNPDRYLVVNSGMTFREFSNVSNSRQVAMLPDFAVIDVTDQDDSIYPGTIVKQGFFNEQWQLEQ